MATKFHVGDRVEVLPGSYHETLTGKIGIVAIRAQDAPYSSRVGVRFRGWTGGHGFFVAKTLMRRDGWFIRLEHLKLVRRAKKASKRS